MVPIVLATALATFPNWDNPGRNKNQRLTEKEREEATKCHSPYHRMHFGARHTEANGVGYGDGYTTLEGFGIYDENPSFMPFLDLRGHVFNNGKLAGNVGLGSRSVLSGINHMIGAYIYYDVRQENRGLNVVNQVSPGIELLGKRMEYRANGYFHVGRHHGNKYGFDFSKFDGNNVILRYKQKFAMKGGDAEVGAHITQSTKYDLYAGAGPYYFSGGGAHGWGGKVRLLGRYKEWVSLEVSYSHDRVFHNVVQGTVGFNYAFGKRLTRKDRNCPQSNDLMLSRAAFAPYRFEIPVVKKVKKHAKAINPATGQPWQVWFVNNTSSSAGTFQSPFPTLAQAQAASSPNDMIYVFPGDGTTTGLNAGITMKDGQKLFGSGIAQKISTTRGNMTIPAFSSTAPSITGNGGNVITLASGNEISGLNLLATLDTIPGNIRLITGATGTNGANIHDNVFSGNISFAGINITGYGTMSIQNNQMTGPAANSGQAIRLTVDTDQNMNATVAYNELSNFVNGMGMNYAATTSSAHCDILYNTVSNISGGSTGLFNATAGSGVGTGSIIGNRLTNINVAAAITSGSVGGTGSLNILIENNTIELGATPGIAGIEVATTTASTTCASITGNQITLLDSSVTQGMNISATGGGTINIDDFSGNISPVTNVSGNVNFVAPGTCNP